MSITIHRMYLISIRIHNYVLIVALTLLVLNKINSCLKSVNENLSDLDDDRSEDELGCRKAEYVRTIAKTTMIVTGKAKKNVFENHLMTSHWMTDEA